MTLNLLPAEIFIQDRDDILHFSWSWTKPAASLGTFVGTTIELHCSLEGSVGEGITLTEDRFEELQTVRQDISNRTDAEVTQVTQVTKNWKNKLGSATWGGFYKNKELRPKT